MCITQKGTRRVRDSVLHNDIPALENPPNLQNVYSNDLVNPPVNISYLNDTWKIKLNLNSCIMMQSDIARDTKIKTQTGFLYFAELIHEKLKSPTEKAFFYYKIKLASPAL